MWDDFYLSRHRPGRSRDDDGPDILRVDNCSEVDVAGNFYVGNHDGKRYDVCCDSQNEDASECAETYWVTWLIIGIFLTVWGFIFFNSCLCWIRRWTTRCLNDCVTYNTCCNKCYNVSCACCKPQPFARRYGTARSTISTISANLTQAPRPIVSKTPIAPT